MDNERLAKVFVDINSATSIAGAILGTICGEDMVEDDRVIWLISGALEQIEKIKRLAQEIEDIRRGAKVA